MLSFTTADKPGKTRAPAESWVGPGSEVRGHSISQSLCFPFCIEESCFYGWVKVKGTWNAIQKEQEEAQNMERLEKQTDICFKVPTSYPYITECYNITPNVIHVSITHLQAESMQGCIYCVSPANEMINCFPPVSRMYEVKHTAWKIKRHYHTMVDENGPRSQSP